MRESFLPWPISSVLALLVLMGTTASAQTNEPGIPWERDIGPLEVVCLVNETHAFATVTLFLEGQFVGQEVLTPQNERFTFHVIAGEHSAQGHIQLLIQEQPSLSRLKASIQAMQGSDPPTEFQGALGTWFWPDSLIYFEDLFVISTELFAQTTVRGIDRQFATVLLLAGSLPLDSYGMTSTAPTAVVMTDLEIGDVKVFQGTQFSFRQATAFQTGQVFMKGEFQSTNIPPTPIAAIIATWPYFQNPSSDDVKDIRDD